MNIIWLENVILLAISHFLKLVQRSSDTCSMMPIQGFPFSILSSLPFFAFPQFRIIFQEKKEKI